jgi:serine/threonine-protein phosphatase 5
MGSPIEESVELKNKGNKAFAAHDWPTAIDFYTKAIELNPNDATYYSNRAQVCYSRTEEANPSSWICTGRSSRD